LAISQSADTGGIPQRHHHHGDADGFLQIQLRRGSKSK
jgi:hypothetical protein